MIRITYILLPVLLFFFFEQDCYSSQQTIIKGSVHDSSGHPVEQVIITLLSTTTGTYSDRNGIYSLTVPFVALEYTLVFSHIGYRTEKRTIISDKDEIIIDITLYENVSEIDEITVNSERTASEATLIRIPLKDINLLPSASGGFEAILKTMPGVSSNNELSSQYSVRGGNFDENLVYVNDIEIYRPFLIRSGQQEGLSFINPDLASSVSFSSGGFSAGYGDKMSSVLDIRYKKPVLNKGSVSLGLLTSSFHFEGVSKDQKLSYLFGTRYKSSRLMLKTLDAKGNYQPVFADFQSLINYKPGKNSILSFLGTFSSNTYNFVPESRVSNFGSEADAYRLFVLFDGGEKDRYIAWNVVLSFIFDDRKNINHKFLFSSFGTSEKEAFDIRGSYSLNNLDKNFGSENFSDSLMNIGTGSWLSHARNQLSADIRSISYKGEKKWDKSTIGWGIRIRNDRFSDKIKEWTMADSAGYSIPWNSDNLSLTTLIMSDTWLSNWLYETYLRSGHSFRIGSEEVSLNAGIRGLYNSFSKEILVSPRISSMVRSGEKLTFWVAGGLYYQPAFYREMRFPDGALNRQIKSQKSLHSVIGMTYDFKAWNRPFRLSTELYNKILTNIIPYRIDNVRIIYSGENNARGYSRGVDIRLNGEFVPDAESWISMSIMDSKLEIPSKLPGKFPSPSDQTFSVNIFFQDYLPGYPTWRAHVNIAFATGIPITSPYNERYDQYHRLPPYRRVDMGITKIIRSRYSIPASGNIFSYFKEIVAGVEIFNLLDINNTISYLWIKTVNNLSGQIRQFAISNYLTGRSLNFKLLVTF